VRIAGLIGSLMMEAVGGCPKNRPPFKCKCAANRKEILKRPRHPVGTVRMQPMVAHADPHSSRNPMKEHGDGEIPPAKGEYGSNCSGVKKSESDSGPPA
jgi:hypothetical protein